MDDHPSGSASESARSATSFTGTLATQDFALPGDDSGNACLYQVDLNASPNNAAGYGIVNAYEAVKRALE